MAMIIIGACLMAAGAGFTIYGVVLQNDFEALFKAWYRLYDIFDIDIDEDFGVFVMVFGILLFMAGLVLLIIGAKRNKTENVQNTPIQNQPPYPADSSAPVYPTPAAPVYPAPSYKPVYQPQQAVPVYPGSESAAAPKSSGESAVWCTYCGAPISTDDMFCPNCGKPRMIMPAPAPKPATTHELVYSTFEQVYPTPEPVYSTSTSEPVCPITAPASAPERENVTEEEKTEQKNHKGGFKPAGDLW